MEVEGNNPEEVSLGGFLRKKRKALGVTLNEIAEITKINITYLEDIENNQFDSLPGETFSRGFVKSYAKCLRIDLKEIDQLYNIQVYGDYEEGEVRRIRDEKRKKSNRYIKKRLHILKDDWLVKPAGNKWIKRVILTAVFLGIVVGGGTWLLKILNERISKNSVTGIEVIKEKEPALEEVKEDVKSGVVSKTSDTSIQNNIQTKPATEKEEVREFVKNKKEQMGPTSNKTTEQDSKISEDEKTTEPLSSLTAPSKEMKDVVDNKADNTQIIADDGSSSLIIEVLQDVYLQAVIDSNLKKNDLFRKGTRFIWKFFNKVQLSVSDLNHVTIIHNGIKIPTLGEWGKKRRLEFFNSNP